jgi:catechol 2,3-dioxygenase-like lactoylglutathione lyase family enzyme
MLLKLDHLGILTTSLERCAAQIPGAFEMEEVEEQPAEGTREQYVVGSAGEHPHLLLLEPVAPGPYRRAMDKRGPGLHHLGCHTDDLDSAIEHLAARGLLLHSVSLSTYAKGVVWMCRPGIPFLVELYQPSEFGGGAGSQVGISMPHSAGAVHVPLDLIPNVSVVQGSEPALRIESSGLEFTIDPGV